MRVSRRPAALVAVLLVAVTLAGCGQAANAHPANTSAPPSGPFTSLHAVRTSEFPSNNIPAFDHTGTDPAAITALYDTIATLKPWPPGTYNCPLDIGLLYHLTFTRTDGTQVAGLAKPDGCEYASLNGGTDGAIDNWDSFWSLFAAAFSVPVSALQYQP